MSCRVFGQQLDECALGILETRPFPDGGCDLQLVRVLGRDEDAQVYTLRATEGDDAPDVVQGCLAGCRRWLGAATWTPSICRELPFPLESNFESISLFEVPAGSELLEVLAGSAEEHLPEALPIRREPLWLARSRSARRYTSPLCIHDELTPRRRSSR